ncbi:DUF6445 family protein [Allopontixanthobacter sp.]|uniref:DUF6445 family protein n=1 Tax=Allopontixanthobacter sp. TaxID=2906452 RepID=UPI002AB83235|nr:DUF6445 family protein [Allopontixanthobacter sp.]MDZ4306886.1 DUF6445 family protein [Allopontixanthobacter sp.]
MTRPDIAARLIGSERQPLVVVDGFAADPDALRADATTRLFEPAGRNYPGVRAPLPSSYLRDVHATLATILREVFGFRKRIVPLDASFSIVTTVPEQLSLEQRLPHVDSIEPDRFALVHYLSPHNADGTGFFRHRTTGFEMLDEVRAPVYFARLRAELREGGPPAAYAGDEMPLFERTALVEARDNRAVIYRSALLHCGAIGPATTLSSDPASGRLTVTAFFTAE